MKFVLQLRFLEGYLKVFESREVRRKELKFFLSICVFSAGAIAIFMALGWMNVFIVPLVLGLVGSIVWFLIFFFEGLSRKYK